MNSEEGGNLKYETWTKFCFSLFYFFDIYNKNKFLCRKNTTERGVKNVDVLLDWFHFSTHIHSAAYAKSK